MQPQAAVPAPIDEAGVDQRRQQLAGISAILRRLRHVAGVDPAFRRVVQRPAPQCIEMTAQVDARHLQPPRRPARLAMSKQGLMHFNPCHPLLLSWQVQPFAFPFSE